MNANDLPITPKTEPPAAAAPPVSCAVVQDLMPLVRDGVASADSEALVQAHIESCADCRALWDALPATSAAPVQPDDAAVLKTVRTHVRLWLLVVVVVGLALGMAVLNSGRATGLIFVIFPLTCGIACWFDDVIWKLIPILAGGIAAIAFLPGVCFHMAGLDISRSTVCLSGRCLHAGAGSCRALPAGRAGGQAAALCRKREGEE